MYSVFILRIIVALAGGYVAYRKGRDKIIWGILCGFFPPLVLLVLALPPRLANGITKRCVYCRRVIAEKDTLCRHCGKDQPIELVQCRQCGSFVPQRDYCMQCHRKMSN